MAAEALFAKRLKTNAQKPHTNANVKAFHIFTWVLC